MKSQIPLTPAAKAGLPQGWAMACAGSVLDLINGAAFKPTDWTETGLPIIRIQNLNNPDAPYNYCSKALPEKIRVRNGDLLFAWSGTPGTSFGAHVWQGGDAWLNQHIFRVGFNPDLFDTEFLRIAINRNLDDYIAQAHGGAGLAHITKGRFEASSFLLPPRQEQRRIITRLEKLEARSRRARAALDAVPPLLAQTRQSLLAAAFRGQLTADWRCLHPASRNGHDLLLELQTEIKRSARNKKDIQHIENASSQNACDVAAIELGFEPPETWAISTIGGIATVCNGSTPSRAELKYWGGPISWVSSGEVRNSIISETRETISDLGYSNTSLRKLPVGTVLLAMIGEGKTRGQTAILQLEATINQNIAGIVIDHGMVLPRFLWRWFQLRYNETRTEGSGSGPQALNCQRVRELPFVLPLLSEQKEIVRRLESAFAQLDAAAAAHAQALAELDRLDQSLLARAFRGELVPQDPADEPASALLQHIQCARTLKGEL